MGYYRVSTREQGRSGLGLDAQRASVRIYTQPLGTLLAEFTEVESGGSTERRVLSEALERCRKENATLVIAKLDRLARNVGFISRLLDAGVEFVAVDMPSANKLTIHIIAAIAEHEKELISQRTKAALRAAKARGVRLGNPRINHAQALGVRARELRAAEFARKTYPLIEAFKSRGSSTYASIAEELNRASVPTQRGKFWTAAGVRNVWLRGSANVMVPPGSGGTMQDAKSSSGQSPFRLGSETAACGTHDRTAAK
ncbi:recombinase family protein [Stenotrophomonas hibiscicola]